MFVTIDLCCDELSCMVLGLLARLLATRADFMTELIFGEPHTELHYAKIRLECKKLKYLFLIRVLYLSIAVGVRLGFLEIKYYLCDHYYLVYLYYVNMVSEVI